MSTTSMRGMDMSLITTAGVRVASVRSRNCATESLKYCLNVADWSLLKEGVIAPCSACDNDTLWNSAKVPLSLALGLYEVGRKGSFAAPLPGSESIGSLYLPQGTMIDVLDAGHPRNTPQSNTLAVIGNVDYDDSARQFCPSKVENAGVCQLSVMKDRTVAIRWLR